MDPKVFFVGVFCLALIFALASLKARWLKVVPPQVIAAAVGLILGWLLGLSGDRLIQIPDQPFKHGIVLPNFRGLFADHSLWWALATTVLTLTLIDGVESLATIAADRQDRPVPPQVGPEPDALRDGRLEHVLEPGRRADDHPRRRQEHDLHRRRRPDAVGQLLQRLLPDHLPRCWAGA